MAGKREIKIFKTFDDMEANQLRNMAMMGATERFRRLLEMQKSAMKGIVNGPRRIIIHKKNSDGYFE